jgi:hypothetical protein
MSFIVPGCLLLLALLVGIAVDDFRVRKPSAQREIRGDPYNWPFG